MKTRLYQSGEFMELNEQQEKEVALAHELLGYVYRNWNCPDDERSDVFAKITESIMELVPKLTSEHNAGTIISWSTDGEVTYAEWISQEYIDYENYRLAKWEPYQ